jgi:general secretion pathway protein G
MLKDVPVTSSLTAGPAPDARPSEDVARGKGADRAGERGFTLIELLVVIAIMAVMMAAVVISVNQVYGSSKHKLAEQSVERIAGILDIYRLDVGNYPTTEQGLKALFERPSGVAGWNGPYIKDESGLIDPWQHPYLYRSPSQRPAHSFDIMSLGADGKPGGDGEAADIINR